jgi:drug/metabolite transporter (DMT)-like permease
VRKTGSPTTSRVALFALGAQSVFLGYNWVVMKIGLRYSSVWPFAALRCGLGAVVLLLMLVVLRRPLWPKYPLQTVILGLLQTTVQMALLMWALESGAAGRTSALVYTMPFWTLLFAWIFLGERVQGMQWLAVVFALAGLVLVLDPGNLRGSLGSKMLAIGAGLGWAASAIVAKNIRSKGTVDVLNLTAWQMFFGAIPLVIIALVVPNRGIEWTGQFIGALAYNVFLPTALAWFLWLVVLQVLPAGVAGVGTLAAPLIGVVASWIQLHEHVGTLETIGVALILLSLFVLTLRGLLLRRRKMRVESDGAMPVVVAPGMARLDSGASSRGTAGRGKRVG